MIPLAAGYQHFADGAPFAEIALRHPSVKEVYFPWVGEPSGRPMLGFEEEDDPEELEAALKRDLVRLRASGVRLDLLLNANCYGAEAMSVALEKRIAAIVEKLDSWGCRPEVCTTASPFVARTLKASAPDIEVRASVNMRLTTFQAFRYLAPLFDSYCLGRGQKGTLLYTVVKRGLYAHHPHGVEVDETTIRDFFCGVGQSSCARPVPGPQLAARLAEGPTK